ncbi:ANTAR domain-containing protein [Kribbella sp. NPDC054772]
MPAEFTAGAFAEIAGYLAQLTSPTEVAAAATTIGPDLLPGYAVSVMARRGPTLEPMAASSTAMTAADLAQVEFDEGPALDTVRDTTPEVCLDLVRTDLWPQWRPVAGELGWRSWASFCLLDRRRRSLGVLAVAHSECQPLDAQSAYHLRVFAAHIAVALDTLRSEENLHEAVQAQQRVGQASGILMERYELTADQAFSVLRRYSQDQNRKLRDVAAELLSTRELPPAPETTTSTPTG